MLYKASNFLSYLQREHLFSSQRDEGQDDDALPLGLHHPLDEQHLGHEGLASGGGGGVDQVATWREE